MNVFTIKDLENLSGIKAHTIRIWEQRYSFLSPQRTDTNIRFYSNLELQKILNIALLNKYGYKVSHINKMSVEEMNEKILALNQLQAQQERLLNQLICFMIDLEIDGFEKLIDSTIAVRGIEKTIKQVIFPFLERIGILWVTNHINPAQEHLVTNIVRQKLIMGIETTRAVATSQSTVMLFLPEAEFHEVGLLFLYFLLKSRGVKVMYMGTNVPLKDVEFVIKLKNPNCLFVHLTSVTNNFNFEKFLTNASNRIPEKKVYISGVPVKNYQKAIPANFHFLHSLEEVIEIIDQLD